MAVLGVVFIGALEAPFGDGAGPLVVDIDVVRPSLRLLAPRCLPATRRSRLAELIRTALLRMPSPGRAPGYDRRGA
ncbi:MAG: hypothetical protein M3024_01900 [Candidatus Dormibacteraeota bacterium]|nr:hypothetical protein [Candidatus Dormibacteraeota bacterium]